MSNNAAATGEAPVGDESEADEEQTDTPDPTELVAEIETLEAENKRLRDAFAAAQRRRYRRTALGLGVVGLVALGGAALIPPLQTVLVALGATGLFGGVLTYFLTPERFVAAAVGERIYATIASNEQKIIDDLDLRGQPVIIPVEGSAGPARLFVPLSSTDAVDGAVPGTPDTDALDTPFVTDDTTGLAIAPTGAPLYEDMSNAAGELPTTAPEIAATVGDALVEQFELVDGVTSDTEPGRVTLAVEGSAYGSLDRFDHPVASLLATALAAGLKTPVTVAVEAEAEAEEGDWLVTCRWEQG